jgi:putative nucleotidyltransferase with HDIG domain
MSAKILQVVNSSQFGFVKQIADVQQAVVFLGMNTLKSLILSSNLFSSFPEDENYGGSSRDELWIHSLMTARLAKNIASTITSDRILLEEVYTAGLLHDVGKLIFSKIPMKYTQVEAFMESKGCDRLEAEYAMLKTSHAELGAYLLGRWELSNETVETTAFHHQPSSLINDVLDTLNQSSSKEATSSPSLTESLTGLTILTSVHVANALMIQKELTPSTSSFTHIDMLYIKALGFTDKLYDWAQLAVQSRQKIR